ncbi:unnamed protein product [Arctogadus glacialis]
MSINPKSYPNPITHHQHGFRYLGLHPGSTAEERLREPRRTIMKITGDKALVAQIAYLCSATANQANRFKSLGWMLWPVPELNGDAPGGLALRYSVTGSTASSTGEQQAVGNEILRNSGGNVMEAGKSIVYRNATQRVQRSNIYSKPAKDSIGPMQSLFTLATFAVTLLVPAGWILHQIPVYRQRSPPPPP